MNEWISVDDRLPARMSTVLVYTSDCDMIVQKMYHAVLNSLEFPNGVEITHWQPLPYPPKATS